MRDHSLCYCAQRLRNKRRSAREVARNLRGGQTVARLTFEDRGSEEIVLACSFTEGSKVSDVADNQGHDTDVSEGP